MHTNYYKVVKQLKSFKTIIFTLACFGLHKPSSGSYSLCFAKVTILITIMHCAFCTVHNTHTHTHTHTHTTGLNEICSDNTEYFNNDLYIAINIVPLAKRRLQLPGDGLCKPKHVDANIIV